MGLAPPRRLLPAADTDESNTGDLRYFLRQAGVCQIFHLGQWQLSRGQGERKDRSVSRIDLVVDWRIRQVRGQISRRRIDRSLQFLLGHVDVETEYELERYDRTAE